VQTLPPHQEAHALPTRSVPMQARLKIHSMEISTVMTERREVTDEELELIEMRYQQALALLNLEPLFAEGLINCV
jgi:outer membrane protein TolC